MSQSLLEMTKELVTEQIRMGRVTSEDIQDLLHSTHATLQRLYEVEMARVALASPEAHAEGSQVDWKRSIAKHAVRCLECGETLKQLSTRHLRKHDLNPRSYRTKYGIPSKQPLSAHVATARRRELVRQIRPWEQAASKREADKTSAKKRGGKS
ncbi:MucR family transcriptional regulator [Candidatus Entotheonella palauensis]|uniref:MucR family transcriptional regulator n=1 Tax=Candidatus Entotheonella palauensis TaxID=93172 RepID=UPI0015C4BCC4|nr:MucR family transcriptional regulator [Candidatus Entotheonella palauensis]